MSTKIRYALVSLIILAFGLRLHQFFYGSFQPDEALFASWARLIAALRDPLLQNQVVDKPPLLFYLQAFFYPLLGPVTQSARLPNLIASILLVPLLYRLVWNLYGHKFTAITSALLVVLSPLIIRYSSTAFIDPLMITLAAASLVAVSNKKDEKFSGSKAAAAAGILMGLAVAAKYQALLYIPLVVAVGLLNGWRRKNWLHYFGSLTGTVMLVLIWDLAQSGSMSLVSNQWRSLGGIRIIWSHEMLIRFNQLLHDWTSIFAFPAYLWIVLLGTPIFIIHAWRAKSRSTEIDVILLLFTVGCYVLFWLVAVPLWSRYVLLTAPIVIILFVRMLAVLWQLISNYFQQTNAQRKSSYRLGVGMLVVLLVLGLGSAYSARSDQTPFVDLMDNDGSIEEISEFLSDQPTGTVVYDHWYSWLLRYSVFDRGTFVSWFPDGAALTNDLETFGRDGTLRYIVLPNNDTAKPVKRAVDDAGFQLTEIDFSEEGETSNVALYRILTAVGD